MRDYTVPDHKPAARPTPRLLAVLVAGCFGAASVGANPGGAQVVSGQAGFSSAGKTLTITNTPGAIINWQSFSINPGEVTRFMQQSASSGVLNRIVGQDPSQILGSLQSNGKVFLINPNGIVFGRGAQVDVNGLVASSLNLRNEDFLAGKLKLTAGAQAGQVANQGTITTPSGGQVYLIAPQVENSGVITSPKGDIVLAAGRSVQLVDSSNSDVQVLVSAPADQAINLGQVVAQSGRIGIYGALVTQRGAVNANSAVLGENGKIVFKASGDTLLESGSRTSATGAGKGGDIAVLGARVGVTGDAVVDASGQTGGGTVLVGGDYQGANASIQNAKRSFVGGDARIRADAIQSGDGGKVVVWSDEVTRAYGNISARGGAAGGNGGFVEVSGKQHLDFHAKVDVGAKAGKGGTLLLDPEAINLIGGFGDGAADGIGTFQGGSTEGTVNFADPEISGATSNIYQSELEGLAPGTNVVLEASKSIAATGMFNGNQITLGNNSDLSLRTRNAASDAGGTQGIDLVSGVVGPLTIAASGTGSVTVQTGTGASPIAADIKLPNIQTTGGAVNISGSGNVSVGSITTTPAGSPGGNVDIAAGASGYLYASGNIDARPGVVGASGNVTLVAGTHIAVATGQTVYANQLRMTSGSGIHASFSSTGATDDGAVSTEATALNARNTGAGAISISNMGGNLSIADIGGVGYGVRQDTAGQNISIFTGNGEKLSVDASVMASGGTIFLKADKFALGAAVNAGASGTVTLVPGGGTAIQLGGLTTDLMANTLELSNAELNQITAGTLRIGDIESSGAVGIASAIAPAGVTTALSLAGGTISQQAGATINVPGLSLLARNAVTLLEANPTGNIGGQVAFGNFQYRTSGPLSIGTVANQTGLFVNGNALLQSDSAAGITQSSQITATGGLALKTVGPADLTDTGNSISALAADLNMGGTGTGALAVFSEASMTVGGFFGTNGISTNNRNIALTAGTGAMLAVETGTAVSAGSAQLALTADKIINAGALSGATVALNAPKMALAGGTIAGTTAVLLDGGAAAIQLGGATTDLQSNVLELSNAELNRITTPTLRIGSASTGNLSIVSALQGGGSPGGAFEHVSTMLALQSGGSITQTSGSTIQGVPGLKLVGASVSLAENNGAGVVAGAATAGNFEYRSGGALTVGTVDGASGIQASGGSVTLHAEDGAITLGAPVTATGQAVNLTAVGAITGSAPITGASLNATAGNGIGHAAPLTTQVGALTATNTGTNGDIRINNTGVLVLNAVTQDTPGSTGAISIDNTGAMSTAPASLVTTRAGSITLLARSPLTINGTVASSDGGAISLTAGATGASTDKLTIGVSGIVNTTGAVTLRAGDAIVNNGTVNGAPVTQTPNTNTPPPVTPPPATPPPTLGECVINPALAGCSAVLPSVSQCVAAPTTAGCAAVLPSVASCVATPTMTGCAAVLPGVAICIAAPTTAGCSAVLPSIAACSAAPTTPGCSAVLPSVAVCAAAPTTPGCAAVLPSIAICTTAPTTAGCSAVLPSVGVCAAVPTTAGCSAVLPNVAICIAAPTTPGCSIVLPSLGVCSAAPTIAGCSVVLPSLATCISTPNAAGCAAILPSLAMCTSAPTMAGCSAVLPTLAQCTTTPTLAGCTTVLPPVNICLTNPSAAGCAVVLPPAITQTSQPVQQAINNTVNIINTVTTTVQTPGAPTFVSTAKVVPPPTPGPATTGTGGSSTPTTTTTTTADASGAEKNEDKKDEKKDEKKEEKKEEKVSEKSEAKNEPPPPKTFCN